MRTVVYGFVFLVIAVILIYSAITIYGNLFVFSGNPYNIPESDKAHYSVRIINTGLTFYTNDLKDDKRTIELNNYWEYKDAKFKYVKNDIFLDREIFGPIRVTVRN